MLCTKSTLSSGQMNDACVLPFEYPIKIVECTFKVGHNRLVSPVFQWQILI